MKFKIITKPQIVDSMIFLILQNVESNELIIGKYDQLEQISHLKQNKIINVLGTLDNKINSSVLTIDFLDLENNDNIPQPIDAIANSIHYVLQRMANDCCKRKW